MQYSATPAPQGLYDPQFERDACGVAAVADIKGRRSHSIVNDGVTALINLDHRGAAGADPAVGDGAGILIQVPDELFRAVADFALPVSADPAARPGLRRRRWRSCPPDADDAGRGQGDRRRHRRRRGSELLGWRTGAHRPGRLRCRADGRWTSCRPSSSCSWPARPRRRHPPVRPRPGPDGLPGPQADRARHRRGRRRGARRLLRRRCPAAPSSTRAC